MQTLIVQSAIDAALTKCTVVIGKYTDLLILLIHAVITCQYDIFFRSNEKSQLTERIWDIKYTQEILGVEIYNAILPIHAILRCDTTSRMNTVGMKAAMDKFRDKETFRKLINKFIDPFVKQEEIIRIGETSLVILYGGKNDTTLDRLRFEKFHQKIAVSSIAIQPETPLHRQLHSIRCAYTNKFKTGLVMNLIL